MLPMLVDTDALSLTSWKRINMLGGLLLTSALVAKALTRTATEMVIALQMSSSSNLENMDQAPQQVSTQTKNSM